MRKPNSTSACCASESFGPSWKPLAGIKGLQPRRGLDQLDPVLFQLIGNGAEDRVRVLFLEPQQQGQRAEVGAEVVEVLRGDLARHDALADAAAGEGGDHLRELADLEPDDLVHQRGERGVGFAFERDGHEPLDPLAAGFSGEDQRQRTIAGDNPQAVRRAGHGCPGRSRE